MPTSEWKAATSCGIAVIGTRRRGSPLDLIVAEAMILANSSWGGWLGISACMPDLSSGNAWQAVRNNVLGTLRVARAAIASGVGEFVMISTDKAANPALSIRLNNDAASDLGITVEE